MAQVALQRADERTEALREIAVELLGMEEPRKRIAAEMSGLGIRYDFGEGHPLVGRRMPDLDLVTPDGPLRVYTLLRNARPVLLDLGAPGSFDAARWQARVASVFARYDGAWELPASAWSPPRLRCWYDPMDMSRGWARAGMTGLKVH